MTLKCTTCGKDIDRTKVCVVMTCFDCKVKRRNEYARKRNKSGTII